MDNSSRAVRERLAEALRRELMGPTTSDEVIDEYPTSRYLVGRLAPARSSDDDEDAKIDPAENDTLGVGVADGVEEGEEDVAPPLIIGFNPSSFGISFLVEESVHALRATVTWGDYARQKDGSWQRAAREAIVNGINIVAAGPLRPIWLSPELAKKVGASVSGVDDPEIAVEGVVHKFGGYRAVSLFVVNRRTKGQLGDRSKDERWIYQPRLLVTVEAEKPVFVAKDFRDDPVFADDDGDTVVNTLLYRNAREFATGHGVAVGWRVAGDPTRATAVFSEFLPQYEVPLLVAREGATTRAVFDMKALAETSSADRIVASLLPIVEDYEAWIDAMTRGMAAQEIQADAQLKEAAQENIRKCRDAAARMRAGIQLLDQDRRAFEAFRFANRTMWDQRIHSLWAARNRKVGEVQGSAADFDLPENRTWRPFQMGFFLLNLRGIAAETSEDRRLVDLLWFPTGGGKTEAYLGIAAFTLALRRLRGDRHGMYARAGVSIIMRYTLRLLTVQQFQRAAALISACELIRRSEPETWGTEPFRIGVWVGRNTTPNSFSDSQKALEDLADGKKPRGGSSPVQLVSCPRCGAMLVDTKGKPEKNTYQIDRPTQRTLIWCANNACEFSGVNSEGAGLPAVVVDEEIYRTCPSFIVATVDKFARLPFRGQARTLFGLRDRFSATLGHLSEADADTVGGRKVRDASPAPRLLPPELIIQDELHLISGPLGTMVGLYETAVDYASSVFAADTRRLPAKVIASTATIRRAAQQTHQLYGGRKLAIFPPSGLDASDSYFAREVPINPEEDRTAGRLYVGVNAPGSSAKTLLVRVYSVLLAAAEAELQQNAAAADPYGTLVGYFNSLRALGGAKRLVEDDVKLTRLKYLARQRDFPRRNISDPAELTSRMDSWRIPGLLKQLDNTFPRAKDNWPVDVLLATNMISVGVDIDRLGLMVVAGQPKTTAEYIQATSRVGRRYPGLVVTMYNWLGARDLSHYERFESYHAALYRYVEAISVTPFSSRALDRGLRGAFAAMNRLMGPDLAQEADAINFDPAGADTASIIEDIYQRAALLGGKVNADLVRDRLYTHRDNWAHLADSLLRYSWLDNSTRPPNNSRVLLRTAGTYNEGEWPVPASLREVEPTAAFFLDEEESLT